jgi:UDP-glucose 4-epimerase
VTELTGKSFPFVEADVRDRAALDALFRAHEVDAVIHFAGLKAVGESVEKPLLYWDNNVCGSVTLLQTMAAAGVKTLVFSSSCTVYGDPASVPIREDSPIGAQTNPYGRSKLVIEQILTDLEKADPAWRIALLRYFNPVGAHASGRIGEDPRGIPNNLVPYVAQVAVGRREALNVFGDDYPTRDGTGIRDYLHVVDLAVAHVKAVEKLAEGPGVRVWNLGTGRGCSVLEVVRAFEKASGRAIPYRVVPRRPGDIAQTWADPSKAERELGWKALRGLDEMCVDSWRWQESNPNGFGDAE